jgi:hypothetical protein
MWCEAGTPNPQVANLCRKTLNMNTVRVFLGKLHPLRSLFNGAQEEAHGVFYFTLLILVRFHCFRV